MVPGTSSRPGDNDLTTSKRKDLLGVQVIEGYPFA